MSFSCFANFLYIPIAIKVLSAAFLNIDFITYFTTINITNKILLIPVMHLGMCVPSIESFYHGQFGQDKIYI